MTFLLAFMRAGCLHLSFSIQKNPYITTLPYTPACYKAWFLKKPCFQTWKCHCNCSIPYSGFDPGSCRLLCCRLPGNSYLCTDKILADSCDKSQPTPFTYRTLGVSCGHYVDCPKINFPWSIAFSGTGSTQFQDSFHSSLYRKKDNTERA